MDIFSTALLLLSHLYLFTTLNTYLVYKCPTTRLTWVARSKEVSCDYNREEFYHCYRNKTGELEESCRRSVVVNPEKGCPYFSDSNQLAYFKCSSDLRCPKRSDSFIYSSELFIYPGCLQRDSKTTSNRIADHSVSVSTAVFTASFGSSNRHEGTNSSDLRTSTQQQVTDRENSSDSDLDPLSIRREVWYGGGALLVAVMVFLSVYISRRKVLGNKVKTQQRDETHRPGRQLENIRPNDALNAVSQSLRPGDVDTQNTFINTHLSHESTSTPEGYELLVSGEENSYMYPENQKIYENQRLSNAKSDVDGEEKDEPDYEEIPSCTYKPFGY